MEKVITSKIDNDKMNELLEKFLSDAESKHNARVQSEKKTLLIKAGLFTTEREYRSARGMERSYYDKEKQSYYVETKVPIEVTEEEFEMVKAIMKEKERKDSSEQDESKFVPSKQSYNITPSAEKVLSTLVSLGLVFCIISVVVILGLGCYFGVENDQTIIVVATVCAAALVLVSGILLWASRRVIINISNNLHYLSDAIEARFSE